MTSPAYNTQLSQFLPTAGQQIAPTMSSVDIAELTGKRHDHVLRDIRKMLAEINAPKSGAVGGGLEIQPSSYRDAKGEARECFNLPKRECLILVSGYSVELRAKVIDRWMELEQVTAAAPVLDFRDPAILFGVLNSLQTQLGEKDQIISDLGQKAQQLDRIEATAGSICLTDAAKTLKKGPQELIRFMSSRGWIYKRAGNTAWIGRQQHIGSGYLEHKEHVYVGSDGYERVSTRVLVTGKGLVKLSEMLALPLH